MGTGRHILLATLLFAESLAQQVTTPDGPIKGVIETTNNRTTYYAYYSIPYAKAPIGTRRLQPTEPIDPWTEVHDGTVEKSNICYQSWSDYPQESEDCLYMNVFTPQDPTKAGDMLPVMVNIHGGGFMAGSGLVSTESVGGISPKYLIEEQLVFVSFNYRLGPFGFLSTGDDVVPGNNGLRDQIMALKWVQRNIAAFGGDPEKVTISGQSAGAASVGCLILSPAAKGLFSGAILESGSALEPWAYQRNQTEITFKTASYVDSQFAESSDSKKLLEVLQSVDAAVLDKAGYDFLIWDSSQADAIDRLPLQQGFQYAPVVEETSAKDPILSEYQHEAAASGKVNKVPILIGTCAEEGLMNLNGYTDYYLTGYDNNHGFLVPQDMHISDPAIWKKVGDLIKQEYSPDDTFLNYKLGGIQFFTDQDFVKPSTKFASLHSSHSDVFYYEFAYTGMLGFNTDHKYPGSRNVTHAEEMSYLFWGRVFDYFPDDDQLVHYRLVRLWGNFVKYHHPTPNAEELLGGIIWPKVSEDSFHYLEIGNFTDASLTLGEGKPRAERMAFWENLYDKYGNRPFDTY